MTADFFVKMQKTPAWGLLLRILVERQIQCGRPPPPLLELRALLPEEVDVPDDRDPALLAPPPDDPLELPPPLRPPSLNTR